MTEGLIWIAWTVLVIIAAGAYMALIIKWHDIMSKLVDKYLRRKEEER